MYQQKVMCPFVECISYTVVTIHRVVHVRRYLFTALTVLSIFTLRTQAQSPQASKTSSVDSKTSTAKKVKSALSSFRIDARTSPRGVVVGAAFFAPSSDSKCDTVAALILRKSVAEKEFRQIARIERAATLEAAKERVLSTAFGQQAWEFFVQTAGATMKERAEERLWQTLKSEPRRAIASLFLPYPSVAEALGLMYTDTTTLAMPAGTELVYAVRYELRNGSTIPVEPIAGVRVVLGRPLRSLPPRLQDVYEQDSVVALRFASPHANEQELSIAAVFRQIDGIGAFEQLPLFVTPNVRNDSMIIAFEDRVEPEHIIRYFVQMRDGAGNIGAHSDTATVISIDQNRVQRITKASAHDTTNGIFLQWKPIPAKPYYLGIEILRAIGAGGSYVPLDTVSLHDSTYLDINVRSGQEYFYTWRTIMLRPSPEVPLVWASAVHRNRTTSPLAPYGLEAAWEAASGRKQAGVRLVWQGSPTADEQGISHYLVYRAPAGRQLEVISKPLDAKTTTYLDTDSTLNGRTVYTYTVRAVSVTGLESQNARLVRVRPEKAFAPKPPAGLGGYEDDKAMVTLRWTAGASEDESVVKFAVYRRLGASFESHSTEKQSKRKQEDWKLLAHVPSTITTVRDTTVHEGATYSYAVTAIDVWGNESERSAAFHLSLSEPEITPPSRLYARAVANGVELSWSEQARNDMKEIVIYRRNADETAMQVVAVVKPYETSFLDKAVKRDELYVYALKVVGMNNRESLPSREVSIRP